VYGAGDRAIATDRQKFRFAVSSISVVGAGVLASALVETRFDVTGIDDSPDLVAIAALNVPRARFVKASIYELEIPECEAIVAIGEALTYHQEVADADRSVWNFFQRAARILPAGGMLIFDVIETGESTLAGRTGDRARIGPC
jgi:hypothetical protein